MLPSLLLLASLSLSQTQPPVGEPDGSRTMGIVPPFRAEPAPPDWLRATSHTLASINVHHYVYEVYAGPKHRWLVRYLLLPDSDEAIQETERAYLFGPNPQGKARKLKTTEVVFEPQAATWRKTPFRLVDRRDLMKP